MVDDTLMIGFEFEFGWSPIKKTTNRPKSKSAYFETVIYPEVMQALEQSFEEKLECVEDCTVRFDQKTQYWKSSFGAEVVTQPMHENDAIDFLQKFLNWMSAHPQVSTNNTCSLHVNVSFKDKTINKSVSYWELLQVCPQEEILKSFSRTNNKFSRPFSKVKFALRAQNRCTMLKTHKQWNILSQRNFSNIELKSIPLVYGWESYEINKDKASKYLFELNTKQFKKALSLELDHTLKNAKKSLAIVEKQGQTGKYFEFRMIGGSGYETKVDEIFDTLQVYFSSLHASRSSVMC